MTSLFELMADLETYETGEASHVQKLQQAQAALRFSIGVAEQVAKETGNRHARAYLIDQLKVHASNDHEFLSRDFNFDRWIEELESGESQ